MNIEQKKSKMLESLSLDRQKLLIRYPFIGAILMSLEFVVVADDSLDTAATDGNKIFISNKFYAKLTLDERLFVLAHEAWHCILLHFSRLQNRDQELFNIAADLEIHFILSKEKFKEPFVLEHDPNWSGLSAEEIYEKLLKKCKHKKRAIRESINICGGNGSFDTHVYADHNQDKIGEFSPKVTSATIEKIRRTIIQSAQMIERTQGNLPDYIECIINKLGTPQLPWRQLLKQFVTIAFGGSRRWLPPARRYISQNLYLPSRRDERFNAVLAVDTSGSTVNDLSQFFGELTSLLKCFGDYNLTVIQCDGEVKKVEKFSPYKPLPANYKWEVIGLGGTSFEPPFEYVKKEKITPDVFIYMTDGYGNAPKIAPKYPVLWVLTHDGTQPSAWGKSINMPLI